MRSAYDEAGDDPVQRLTAIGQAYVSFALDHPGHFAVMFRPELTRTTHRRETDEQPPTGLDLLVSTIQQCRSAGYAGDVEEDDLVLLSWSTVHGLAELWLNGPLRGMHGLAGKRGAKLPGVVDALTRLVVGSTSKGSGARKRRKP
jgi:hypothetical protein